MKLRVWFDENKAKYFCVGSGRNKYYGKHIISGIAINSPDRALVSDCLDLEFLIRTDRGDFAMVRVHEIEKSKWVMKP